MGAAASGFEPEPVPRAAEPPAIDHVHDHKKTRPRSARSLVTCSGIPGSSHEVGHRQATVELLSDTSTERGHKTDTSETTPATPCDALRTVEHPDLQEKLCRG